MVLLGVLDIIRHLIFRVAQRSHNFDNNPLFSFCLFDKSKCRVGFAFDKSKCRVGFAHVSLNLAVATLYYLPCVVVVVGWVPETYPFAPSYLRVPLLKPNSRNKSTLIKNRNVVLVSLKRKCTNHPRP